MAGHSSDKKGTSFSDWRSWFLLAFILFLACGLIVPPGPSLKRAYQSLAVQNAHQIAAVLALYAKDHHGSYPSGQTSTEIFQKLLDEKYVKEPGVFYVRMPGKMKATTPMLKAENVCWDVTVCDGNMPDNAPVVFLTGYKVSYRAATSAKAQAKSDLGGTALAFADGSSRFLPQNDSGDIPLFVPAEFKAQGRKFTQLTPDGGLK